MTRRVVCTLATGLALWLAACGPDELTGTTRYVNLPDAAEMPPKDGPGDDGGEGGVDAGEPPEPPGPPMVTGMMPLSGPYGTTIRIVGDDLGSAAREGVTLTLGDADGLELTPESKPEIVFWTESEIAFRFPFPLEAATVTLTTPEGSVVAGEFEPTWAPGERHEVPDGRKAIASISGAEGTIRAIVDTGPPKLVEFGPDGVSAIEVDDDGLRLETLRLYLNEDSELSAFALSTATLPEVVSLDPGADFAHTPTGVDTSVDFRVAGGLQGASVWYRGGNQWERVRPENGTWENDKSIADPNPTGAKHAAATTSDGSLYVAWSEDTGSTLDDTGAVFYKSIVGDASAFGIKVRGSKDTDDSISSVAMEGRGSGIVFKYCGTDKDPFGATSDDVLCYGALQPSGVQRTLKETTGVRYAFQGTTPAMAYCSPNQGVRVLTNIGGGKTSTAELDALAGETVVWPCSPIIAVEVDPEGDAWVVIEHDGALYSPRPRE